MRPVLIVLVLNFIHGGIHVSKVFLAAEKSALFCVKICVIILNSNVFSALWPSKETDAKSKHRLYISFFSFFSFFGKQILLFEKHVWLDNNK